MLKNRMKNLMFLLLAVIILLGAQPGLAQEAPFAPETLSLTPGATACDLNLAWYGDVAKKTVSRVKFIEKKPGKTIIIASGTTGNASPGKVFHKVSVTGLKPGTEYEYAVSNDGKNWSQFYDYKTAGEKSFRFAFVGDPQLTTGLQDWTSALFSDDKTTLKGWQDTVARIAAAKVDFIAGAGDQVDSARGKEADYTNFFAPAELKNIPFAPAVGNHDRHYLFQYHFNLPNEQKFDPIVNAANKNDAERAAVEAAGNYWYAYNNALFVVLNTAPYPDSAAAAQPYNDRFDKTLAEAVAQNEGKYTWLFVQHHKSTASVATHALDREIQYYVEAGFEKLMDKYGVDFVMAGHDHVYARSYVMKGGKVINTDKNGFINADGTVYLTATASAGTKFYNVLNPAGLYVNICMQNKKPQYTIIDVMDNYVAFNTYDIDSDKAVDAFKAVKIAVAKAVNY